MTDEEFQRTCDTEAARVLDSVARLPAPIKLVVLTGALAAAAFAAGAPRDKVIDALNSVFDDIEEGEIPGKVD